jgi:hypothetical protein
MHYRRTFGVAQCGILAALAGSGAGELRLTAVTTVHVVVTTPAVHVAAAHAIASIPLPAEVGVACMCNHHRCK